MGISATIRAILASGGIGDGAVETGLVDGLLLNFRNDGYQPMNVYRGRWGTE